LARRPLAIPTCFTHNSREQNRWGEIMRFIRSLVFGAALAAVALPSASRAYTPEEQAACQPDAFRLCGSEIPDIERVKACMIARRAQLSPECKRFFRADPPAPDTVAAPPAGRPVNIKLKTTKPPKPAATKSVTAKKPATPKAKKPAKPPSET
jgi:hypothetical protein